jgi:ferredoxin-thioredoxin reductase catalytic chain
MSIDKRKQMANAINMVKFAEIYAARTSTFFCIDRSVTALVIDGLARHKAIYNTPLCPCRHYENKEAEVDDAYWNCPCIPMRERKECHCMLFLTPQNEFASFNQVVDLFSLIDLILG